jgi:hypothetical protein
MNTYLRKITSGLVATTTAVVLSAGGFAASAFAGQLTSSTVTLGNPALGQSSSYTIQFTAATATPIRYFKFVFATGPSGSVTRPTNLNLAVASNTAVTYNGSSNAILAAVTPTIDNTSGVSSIIYDAGAGNAQTSAAGGVWKFTIGGITNMNDGDGCDAVANSESCYVRITTSDASNAVVDTGSSTFTAITSISVSATIDPFMTLTVLGVGSSVTAQTNDTDLTGTSSTFIAGTTATNVPFGNVTVTQPKYAQQSLSVKTNAGNGYNIYHKFTNAAAGTNVTLNDAGSNYLTVFDGAAGTATFASPAAWATPTGATANNKSGWIGIRSTGAGQFVGSLVWGTPAVNAAATGNLVMSSSGPDNGLTATRKYVTYQIEVNAFQPAQAYTGTMLYNAVASY